MIGETSLRTDARGGATPAADTRLPPSPPPQLVSADATPIRVALLAGCHAASTSRSKKGGCTHRYTHRYTRRKYSPISPPVRTLAGAFLLILTGAGTSSGDGQRNELRTCSIPRGRRQHPSHHLVHASYKDGGVRVRHRTFGPMGTAGLPMVRPEHVLNCSPPSPGGCGSGFKATGTDSRVPPLPPPWICLMSHAGGGRGRGSLHCGAHRASGRGAGRSHEMVGFVFASAGFTQFSLGCFVRLSGVHAVCFVTFFSFVLFFLVGTPLGSDPPSSPSRSLRCRPHDTHARTMHLLRGHIGARQSQETFFDFVPAH